jgi:hypothetical protein
MKTNGAASWASAARWMLCNKGNPLKESRLKMCMVRNIDPYGQLDK